MKHILIIGGGYGGLFVARELQKTGRFLVTLVDKKDYFENTVAQLRALVDPETTGRNSRVPYREILGESFVHGEVVSLSEKSAQLADGTSLDFDWLVLAPGSVHPSMNWVKSNGPTDLQARYQQNHEEFQAFSQASGYLVVGGGLVGVELAGELAAAAPGKKVRLAHRGPRLLPALPEATAQISLDHLKAVGVEIVPIQNEITPLPGEKVYQAFSPSLATGFLGQVQPPILDDKNQIQVDPYLQVTGHPGWFALGDAANLPEAKMALTTGAQAEYLVKHLMRLARGKTGSAKPYKPGPLMALVPIGKTHGVAHLPFGPVTWKPLVKLKGRDLLTNRFRSRFGLKALKAG